MRALLRTGIVLLVTSLATSALAAPPAADGEGSSPAITEAARARFNEGLKLYGKKKYDRAQAAFLQAYGLTKAPAVLINLGLTALKMGNPLQAARYFDKFQKESKDATPDQRSRAQKGILEARRSLGSIEIAAPEGAEVTVDGEPVGRAPLAGPVDVLPGHHDVTATTTSESRSQATQVAAAGAARVRLVAQRPTAPPSAVLDPAERAPTSDASAPPPAPETTGAFSPPASTWPVYTAGVIGLASLTAAIVLSGIGANADRNVTNASDALRRNGKSPDSCSDPSSTGDPTIGSTCSTLRSGQKTSSDVSGPFVATLAIGAGATAFALGWYFFAPKAHASSEPSAPLRNESVRITPSLGRRGEAGATLDLTF